MYHEYTQDELRLYCRANIETLEIWARRLIHEKMSEEYGVNYIDVKINDKEYLIKKDIRKHIKLMLNKEPYRYKRPVDTLFIDHIIYFLCNPKWYKKLFKRPLDYIYPQGKDEAREFLNRLVPIRNPLSHSNLISMHQVEQAICYSHDFVEGLKKYYKEKGEEQLWNVPRIIRIKDSFGNVFDNYEDAHFDKSIFIISNQLYCGDTYSIEVEIDSSFEKENYTIHWEFTNHKTVENENRTKFSVKFKPEDVAQQRYIYCTVTSTKNWHKHGNYDSKIAVGFAVYPPIK